MEKFISVFSARLIPLLAAMLLLLFFMPGKVGAQSLEIQDVTASVAGTNVTITIRTNKPALPTVEYGISTIYSSSLGSNIPNQATQAITLINLKPETTYHFRIIARAGSETVSTFDRFFKTGKPIVTPALSNVHAVYVTGTSATIQWLTNEPSSSRVKYGKTSAYTNSKGIGTRVTQHDVTITGLQPATHYHYQVSSLDNYNNVVTFHDLEFTTLFTTEAETMPLVITGIRPLTPADPAIFSTSITISWRTNKLAKGRVSYGTDAERLRTSVSEKGFRGFEHMITLEGLEPSKGYYFKIESLDVFGKVVKSDVISVMTKAGFVPVTAVDVPLVDSPTVLGFSTVDLTRASAACRVIGSPDVFMILYWQKYRVPGGSADLAAYGLNPAAIRTVSQAELDRYPFVKLVRSPETSKVYYLYRRPGGVIMKLHIPSPAVFSSYPANRWQDVVTILQSDIDAYPNVKVVKTADSSTVYEIQSGERRPIVSYPAFLALGYRAADVAEINNSHLLSFPLGSMVL